MDKNLSLRKNSQLIGLFLKVKEYQPLSNRIDIFNEAVKFGLEGDVDYKKLSKMKINYTINDEDLIPEFIQLRTDKEQWNNLVDKIQNSFTPPLLKITTPYVVKLVLLNYILELEKMSTINLDEKLEEVEDKESEFTIVTNDLYGIDDLKKKTFAIIDFYLNCLKDEKTLLKNKQLINNNFELIDR